MTNEGFEKGLNRLEEIGNLLKEGKDLEESLSLYKEAKDLARSLEDKLDQAELTVKDLSGNIIEDLKIEGNSSDAN